MKKKICFVTTVAITIKSFLVPLARYLTANGYDVTFICNDDESMRDYEKEGIHFIPVKMKRGVGFDGIGVINSLTCIFKEQKFDIVQYSTPNAALYASIASKCAGIKNRLYCQWGIRYMGFDGGIKRVIFKMIEKITCDKSSIIETESFSLYDFSVSEGLYPKEKSSVVWNGSACGVDTEKLNYAKRGEWRKEIREELRLSDDTVVFGFAGRITRDKGMNELLEAFRAVSSDGDRDTKLLLVGSFDNEGTIKDELKNWSQTSKDVIFVDWTDKLEKYYAAMDVFASLSYREGFGLVVVEAAAMGLPAIVTDVPGQIDTAEDMETGILVPAKNVDKVIGAIKFYTDNKEKRLEMSVAAHDRAVTLYEQKELFRRLKENRDKYIEG